MSIERIETSPAAQLPESSDRPTGMPRFRGYVELLLGFSFLSTVGGGFYGVVTHHTSLFAELSAIAFLCTLVAVVVPWFVDMSDEDATD